MSSAQASTPAAATTSAATPKCNSTPIAAPTTTPAMAEPTMPPTLKNAWKLDRIGCPTRRSISTPCAFMDTSCQPLPTPRQARPTTRTGSEGASPAVAIPTAMRIVPTNTMCRLLYRPIRLPVIGIARTAPAAIESSAKPRTESLRPSRSRISGMRDAHVPNVAPFARNATMTPIRARRSTAGAVDTVAVGWATAVIETMVGARGRLCRIAARA